MIVWTGPLSAGSLGGAQTSVFAEESLSLLHQAEWNRSVNHWSSHNVNGLCGGRGGCGCGWVGGVGVDVGE